MLSLIACRHGETYQAKWCLKSFSKRPHVGGSAHLVSPDHHITGESSCLYDRILLAVCVSGTTDWWCHRLQRADRDCKETDLVRRLIHRYGGWLTTPPPLIHTGNANYLNRCEEWLRRAQLVTVTPQQMLCWVLPCEWIAKGGGRERVCVGEMREGRDERKRKGRRRHTAFMSIHPCCIFLPPLSCLTFFVEHFPI